MPRGMSPEMWRQLNANKGLRKELLLAASRVAARARTITSAEGGDAVISTQSGVRPGGRAFTNIVSDSRDEEFGSEATKKIRAIGRASREV